MLDAKSWFIENYREPIAQPTEGLFPDPCFSCENLGIKPPAPVHASMAWYWEALSDFGGAWSLRYDVEGVEIFLVFCGTDGDEGAVEIFNSEGELLTSAFLLGDEQIWETPEQIQSRFARLYGLDE